MSTSDSYLWRYTLRTLWTANRKGIRYKMDKPINIILDSEGHFVEIETDEGKSIGVGEWKQRPDKYWSLRITRLPQEKERQFPDSVIEAAKEAWPDIDIDKLECECKSCSRIDTCPYAFDLYNLYTTDGRVADTGPLCLK